ncbi:neurogranin (protein kinase C substrate, RC3) a isoform X1 [Alosa pseudoharengus]|uniref:neurogranin (protein kinase C substrate, RC3) a isoform X1 n=1 Tax=Alosa pseudoharengus TaxID=34774 RepID=UPI003F88E0E0
MANPKFVLLFFVVEVTAVRVYSPLGLMARLPCKYEFEILEDLKQLSLQWKSPSNELLCHFIKHKAYQKCTPGYSLEYSPNNVTLTIRTVRRTDFGTHVCSVSKSHEFSDFSIDLILKSESSSNSSVGSGCDSGHAHPLSSLLCLIVIIWQCRCHSP